MGAAVAVVVIAGCLGYGTSDEMCGPPVAFALIRHLIQPQIALLLFLDIAHFASIQATRFSSDISIPPSSGCPTPARVRFFVAMRSDAVG